MGESIGVRELRGLLGHYFKGVPGAPRIREALTRVATLADVEGVLDAVGDGRPYDPAAGAPADPSALTVAT
jgi:tRNA-dihydrouridine synthase